MYNNNRIKYKGIGDTSMENIIITFDSGEKREYEKGVKLSEIINDIKKNYKHEIISAKFKNQIISYEDALMKSGTLELFDITTSQGNKIYERGLIYLFQTCTLRVLGKDTKIKIRHPIDKGIFCEIDKKITKKDVEKIKELMEEKVRLKLPFEQLETSRIEAIEYFKKLQRLDKVKNEAWVAKADELGNETDFIVSNSEFENMVYRTSYWENTEILEYGHARNDMLLNKTKYNKMNKKVREYYNIGKNTKILLYAPTFRDDFSADTYNLDYAKLLEAVKEKFGGNWVLMVRFHFKLRNVDFSDDLSDNIINATDYYDMQELLCAADIGITDYSSWLCDFVLTDKPGFIYCSDMDKYVDERGFYYPLSETPFPISKTNEEFYENIINFDAKKYEKKRQEFLKTRLRKKE